MFSFTRLELTDRFNKSYRALPSPVQKQCKKALGFFLTNPDHPSLKLKPILPTKIYWEARINRPNRIVFKPEGDVAYILDVVNHDQLTRFG